MKSDLPAVMILATPIIQSQDIPPSVRILDRAMMITNATATKLAVQAPCSESALKAIEILSIADPAVMMYTDQPC